MEINRQKEMHGTESAAPSYSLHHLIIDHTQILHLWETPSPFPPPFTSPPHRLKLTYIAGILRFPKEGQPTGGAVQE
jgi:hypothetical protein